MMRNFGLINFEGMYWARRKYMIGIGSINKDTYNLLRCFALAWFWE